MTNHCSVLTAVGYHTAIDYRILSSRKKMENISDNALIINPTNTIPKGLGAFSWWLFLGICIATLPFGGIFLIWMPITFLFVIPHNYKKKMPTSCILDDEKLYVYNLRTGKETWSVPWKDIESIYFISTHWAMPKNIGLRLNNYEHFQASFVKNSRQNAWAQAFARFSTSKAGMMASRMLAKCDTMIAYPCLDRPPKAFAELLFSYMYNQQLKNLDDDSSSAEPKEHEITAAK
jgi:hypothetical protein